jgi:hypothetical protein
MTTNVTTEARYYCAGRNCIVRDKCHRHTSSTSVNRAEFEDYDLVMIRVFPEPCLHFIDRNQAEGLSPEAT